MISLLSKICFTILAFPCQQHTFRLFFSNSLDRSLGLCREMIEQQNTGYITCVQLYASCSLQVKKKNRSLLFQCQLPLVCRSGLESGGRIKRQSVFERVGPWCLIRAIHLITSRVGSTPKQPVVPDSWLTRLAFRTAWSHMGLFCCFEMVC